MSDCEDVRTGSRDVMVGTVVKVRFTSPTIVVNSAACRMPEYLNVPSEVLTYSAPMPNTYEATMDLA